MLNLTYKMYPDLEEYEKNINAFNAFVFVNEDAYSVRLNYFMCLRDTAQILLEELLSVASKRRIRNLTRDNLRIVLVSHCGINESWFYQKGITKNSNEKKYSLDSKRVVTPLHNYLEERLDTLSSGYELAYRILDMYMHYTKLNTLVDNARAKIKLFDNTPYKGYCGDLKLVRFKYTRQLTGRYYSSNDNIQAWNKHMLSTITAPKDYILLWADFSQIDFRIAYEIYLKKGIGEYSKIYTEAEDKYYAIYEIMCLKTNRTPDKDEYLRHRPEFKRAVLAAVYNASKQTLISTINDRGLAEALYTFINENSSYKEFRDTLTRVFEFGISIPVRDYFGFDIDLSVPATDNIKESVKSRLISQGCNTGIQATSNSIKVLWLNSICKKLMELGYVRDRDFICCMDRHDEDVMLLHKSCLKDLWVFKNYSEICVDDWEPITMKIQLGFNYSEVEEKLMQAYEEATSKERVGDKLDPRTVFEQRQDSYRIVSDVLHVYTYSMMTHEEFYDMIVKDASEQPYTDIKDYYMRLTKIHEDILNNSSDYLTQASIELVKEFFKYGDKFVLYSNKRNMYKTAPCLQSIEELAERLNTRYMVIHSVFGSGRTFYNNMFIRFNTDDYYKTYNILYEMHSKDWTESLVSLNA